MPRHYINEEWDRDALFASRNLVSPEFAAHTLNVTTHALDKAASRVQAALLVWIFGGRGQVMRKYRESGAAMGQSPGPDLPHAWHGHSAEELLGEPAEQHANSDGLKGLKRAAH